MNLKEVNCLARLQQATAQLDDLISFLMEEKLVAPEDVKMIRAAADKPREVVKLLGKLRQAGSLQLSEFEWTILPVERIKITLVTNQASKEFGFNYA